MKDHRIEVFDPNKAIVFHNWTNEQFTWTWGGQIYTFSPGETRYLPEGLAHHFAKHLTDKALLDAGKDVDDQSRASLYEKALVDSASITSHSDVGLEAELLNQKKAVAETVASPAEQPKEEQAETTESVDPARAAVLDRLAKARAARSAKAAALRGAKNNEAAQ